MNGLVVWFYSETSQKSKIWSLRGKRNCCPPKRNIQMDAVAVLPQQRLGVVKAEVDTCSSAFFLLVLQLVAVESWKEVCSDKSRTERQTQKGINWVKAFCEQLATCPTTVVLWWSVNKVHRLFNRKLCSFLGKVLLELLMNSGSSCLSRGDANVLLEIVCVWAASPWLVSWWRARFPWRNALFRSHALWVGWWHGQILWKLMRSSAASRTAQGAGGCFT